MGAESAQTLSFRFNSGAPTINFNFTPFDPGLGILESVKINFNATRRHDWAVWNADAVPQSIAFTAGLGGTTLTLDGDAFAFSALSYGPAVTPLLASTTAASFATEFLTGRAQFLTGAVPIFPSASHSSVSTTITGEFSRPLSFSGNLLGSFDVGTWTIAAPNTFDGSLVDIAGTVTATYTFRAVTDPGPIPAVPEPATGFLAGGMLLGVVAARFFWHKRMPATRGSR